jgi:hypothetical protein
MDDLPATPGEPGEIVLHGHLRPPAPGDPETPVGTAETTRTGSMWPPIEQVWPRPYTTTLDDTAGTGRVIIGG